VQGGLVRTLSKHVDEPVLLRAGTLIQAIAFSGLVAAGVLASHVLLFAAGGLLAVGNGLTQPATSAFVSRQAPADQQGAVLGTNQSFASLARTFGPALGGWLYANIGPLAPYTAAAAGMLVALAFASGLPRPVPTLTPLEHGD
jgi:DHA1 family tetracycline resistance protein-like MFS transporter